MNVGIFINKKFDIDVTFRWLSKDMWFILYNTHENNLSQVISEPYMYKYMYQCRVVPF